MTDRWKSQPRKFCDYCKCWLTDNKPSIEFHEGGKRHKEAVELRIRAARQKGIADSRQQKDMADMLKQIERDALQAMNKDVAEDPTRAAHYNRQLPRAGVRAAGGLADARQYLEMASTAAARRDRFGGDPGVIAQQVAPTASTDLWAEMETENGHVYYYNTRNGETSWTNPTATVAPPPPPPPPETPPAVNNADTTPPAAEKVADIVSENGADARSAKISDNSTETKGKSADIVSQPKADSLEDATEKSAHVSDNKEDVTATATESADKGTPDPGDKTKNDTNQGTSGWFNSEADNDAVDQKSADKTENANRVKSADGKGKRSRDGTGNLDNADMDDTPTKTGERTAAEPGKWNVVEAGKTSMELAKARAVVKKQTVDVIAGVDGTEAAVTFVQKATPMLKRPSGTSGEGITMKKKRRQGNQRGRVTKPL